MRFGLLAGAVGLLVFLILFQQALLTGSHQPVHRRAEEPVGRRAGLQRPGPQEPRGVDHPPRPVAPVAAGRRCGGRRAARRGHVHRASPAASEQRRGDLRLRARRAGRSRRRWSRVACPRPTTRPWPARRTAPTASTSATSCRCMPDGGDDHRRRPRRARSTTRSHRCCSSTSPRSRRPSARATPTPTHDPAVGDRRRRWPTASTPADVADAHQRHGRRASRRSPASRPSTARPASAACGPSFAIILAALLPRRAAGHRSVLPDRHVPEGVGAHAAAGHRRAGEARWCVSLLVQVVVVMLVGVGHRLRRCTPVARRA